MNQSCSTTRIQIFSVLVFRPTTDGKHETCLHYVAGINSQDAQRRILEGCSTHLKGRRFIATDETNSRQTPPDCRLYVSTLTSEAITSDELRRWINSSVKGHWADGDYYPPSHREF